MQFSSNDIFLVTGSSSGIGRSLCLDLNQNGAFVICCGRNTNDLQDLKYESLYPDNIAIEELDLSSFNENNSMWVTDIANKYGKLRGMALIGGIQNIIPVSAINNDKLQEILEINLKSNIFLSKGFIDRRNNIGHGSSLVFMSSISTNKGEPGLSIYAASKAAMNSFSKSLAKEVGKKGIRVNSVLAGLVKTELVEKWKHIYTEDYIENINKIYPLGVGSVADVVPAIRFLLSDDSKWITGSELVVDGGALL